MKIIQLAGAIIAATYTFLAPAMAQDAITIGYFSEWPLPAHMGRESGEYNQVLGLGVNWQAFDSSAEMARELETGNIQIALSQGITPLIASLNQGAKFKIVDVAVSYAEGENCVGGGGMSITRETARRLEAAQIAVPMGTITHFNLLKQLEYLRVEMTSVEIINMPPARAASAFEQGEVEVACAWGPALDFMKRYGNLLMNRMQKEAAGIRVFDLIVINEKFGAENPELVAKFLRVTNDLNAQYVSKSDELNAKIGAALGMTQDAVKTTMADFDFPVLETKLSTKWLGGGIQQYIKEVADFMLEQETFTKSLDSYDDSVDLSYLLAASEITSINPAVSE